MMKKKLGGATKTIKRTVIAASVLLAIFYITRWQLWEAIIMANLTSIDVLLADTMMLGVPLLIVVTSILVAWRKIIWEKNKRINAPFTDDELREQFKRLAERNLEILFNDFLRDRLSVKRENLFRKRTKSHIEQLMVFNERLEAEGSDYALHPHLAKHIKKALNADFPGSDRLRAEMVAAMNEG